MLHLPLSRRKKPKLPWATLDMNGLKEWHFCSRFNSQMPAGGLAMTTQKCRVTVKDVLRWPNSTRVQVYFGSAAVAAIGDYSPESPVWKQVNGQQRDFRGAVCRTGRGSGPAGRRNPNTGAVKCPDEVSQQCPCAGHLDSVQFQCQMLYLNVLKL